MPANLKDKTAVQLRQLCKKKNIRLTKQNGGYRTKSSLLRSLHSKNKKGGAKNDTITVHYFLDDKFIIEKVNDIPEVGDDYTFQWNLSSVKCKVISVETMHGFKIVNLKRATNS